MQKFIHITSLSSTGEGVGSDEGLKVFVEGALPNEAVSVEVLEKKRNYARGKLLSVLTPSEDRTEPICPHFGDCGGCQVMHLQYPAQLLLKRQRVIDALQRIGQFSKPNVLSCLPSPISLGYRNKIQLPVLWERDKKTIGLYRKHTHEVIPISRCFIQCPQGEEILSLISQRLTNRSVRYVLIRNAIFNEEAMVVFVTDGTHSHELKTFAEKLCEAHPLIKGVVENVNRRRDNVILGPRFRLLAGRMHIYEKLLGKTFKISPAAFLQVNPFQTENLYSKALEFADIQPSETVLDAFCGVGTLALLAADRAKEVIGIECVPQAIENAKENARLNEIQNAHFYSGKAEEKMVDDIDIVLLNPPRKGCAPVLLERLTARKIVYISCDPATLARDLKILSSKYEIRTIQPFDMFPQTMHVEVVVSLRLRF